MQGCSVQFRLVPSTLIQDYLYLGIEFVSLSSIATDRNDEHGLKTEPKCNFFMF